MYWTACCWLITDGMEVPTMVTWGCCYCCCCCWATGVGFVEVAAATALTVAVVVPCAAVGCCCCWGKDCGCCCYCYCTLLNCWPLFGACCYWNYCWYESAYCAEMELFWMSVFSICIPCSSRCERNKSPISSIWLFTCCWFLSLFALLRMNLGYMAWTCAFSNLKALGFVISRPVPISVGNSS